jgi:hypothetical protein
VARPGEIRPLLSARGSTVKSDSSYSFRFNEMARPAGLEPAALWFEVRFQRRQQTKANDKHLKNQRKTLSVFGWRRTVLYPVHGQLHGQICGPFGSLRDMSQIS